ncbi:MAG TPA: GNAT family N-acetyltransferase [Blastocatellia bacterium]|jgi:CelD/BcsL family acetyltransferase involved in cellulose biosynthesis|nr:GNAT family N-acetyltransferase [Blastocatellia bacterium]
MDTNLTVAPSALNPTLLATEAEFYSIKDEWDQLLDESDQRAYFLRWAWNFTWWRSFKPANSRLFIIALRDGDQKLIGLAPFYWRQRTTAGIDHIREVLFLGTGIFLQTSESLDIIARRGCERSVAMSVADFLRRNSDWDQLWLNEVPSSSTVLPHLRRALGARAQVAVCNRARYIDARTDWETFKGKLGRATRQNTLRQTRRLFESYDCKFRRIATADELEAAMDALVSLHQARWQSKGDPGSFAIAGFEDFLREAARFSLAEGRLRLWVLEVNGRIAAIRIAFFENGVVYCFQSGFDPAYGKDSIGKVLLGLCVRDCIEDDSVREYNLMGGDDSYKDCWAKSCSDNVSLTLPRSGMRTLAYNSIRLAGEVGRSVARAALPAKIKTAAHRMMIRRHYGGVARVPSLQSS